MDVVVVRRVQVNVGEGRVFLDRLGDSPGGDEFPKLAQDVLEEAEDREHKVRTGLCGLGKKCFVVFQW